jgi:cytochrome c oxidase cbb3-type subunit 1
MSEDLSGDDPVICGAIHALFWMAAANGVGLLLAFLLLVPKAGLVFGELTYGRWLPLHLNWQLYGWTALPLVAWVFALLPQSRKRFARASCLGIRAWSGVLMLGGCYWLGGLTSGKIFLDWTGLLRILFPVVILFLWGVLAVSWWYDENRNWLTVPGLAVLLGVPFGMYFATDPAVYPAVDQSTGGPTGASLLNSTLSVIFLLLFLPRSLGAKALRPQFNWIIFGVFGANLILGAFASTLPHEHRHPGQIACLASLALWLGLLPWYFARQSWLRPCLRWRKAMFLWLGLLIVNGVVSFLPGILDRLKFSDALVAHSHLAMAGFTTSFLIVVLQQFLPQSLATVFDDGRLFMAWHLATAVYVGAMLAAGFLAANDPSFTIHPGLWRDSLYFLRLLCGAVLFTVSLSWWRSFQGILRS